MRGQHEQSAGSGRYQMVVAREGLVLRQQRGERRVGMLMESMCYGGRHFRVRAWLLLLLLLMQTMVMPELTPQN
eukprot:1158101-Pelagomonas_calceolata.AAC.9